MISADDLLKEPVILDDTYLIWECRIMAPENLTENSVVMIMGTVAPRCGSCGGQPKDFTVRFRASALQGSAFKARDKIITAITDQLNE